MAGFLVYGFGIADAPVSYRDANGRAKPCPHYAAWESMLIRCYSKDRRRSYLAYEGCTVDERWRLFSSLREWREQQDWVGKQLDKDLLFEGNRVYGPDTCAMISRSLNAFLVPDGNPDLMPGVISVRGGGYKPIRYTYPYQLRKEKQVDHHFETELEAHKQWLINKHEVALIHAEHEKDPRVIRTLKTRWADQLAALERQTRTPSVTDLPEKN